MKHGFQITARDGAGASSGTWSVVLTGMTQSVGTVYHEHTSSGTALSSWMMNWNAPATLPQGPVIFYACGNDTNNNNAPTGDHIYASTTKLYQATLSTPATTWPIGTSQTLTLAAPGHAGELYFIVPSNDPTPFPISGPFVLEVDAERHLLQRASQLPQVFQNFAGTLDAAGSATATVNIPFFPPLAGLPFYFAAATAHAGAGADGSLESRDDHVPIAARPGLGFRSPPLFPGFQKARSARLKTHKHTAYT